METFLVIRRRRIIALEERELFVMWLNLDRIYVDQIVVEDRSVRLIGENMYGEVTEVLETTTPETIGKIPKSVQDEIARCLAANANMPHVEEIEEA